MKRFMIASMVALAALAARYSFAQNTKAQMDTLIASSFPDNTTNYITPADIRTFMTTLVNAYIDSNGSVVTSGFGMCYGGTTGVLAQPCNSGIVAGNSLTSINALTGRVTCGNEPVADYINTYAYGAGGALTCAADGATWGNVASTFAARTKNVTSTAVDSIGHICWLFADNLTGNFPGWCNYGETRKYPGATGPVVTNEFDFTEFNTSFTYPIDNYYNAYQQNVSTSINTYLQSGGACTAATPCYNPNTGLTNLVAQTAAGALSIGNNGAAFSRAININYNAIAGCDGKTATFCPALSMAMGQGIQWEGCSNTASYPANCAVDNVVARITSWGNSATNSAIQIFQNAAWFIGNTSYVPEFLVNVSASDTSGIAVFGSSTGNPVVEPSGSGNVNLLIAALGAGSVQMQSPASWKVLTIAQTLALSCNAAFIGVNVFVNDTVAATADSRHGAVVGGGSTRVSASASCQQTGTSTYAWQYN
jgi:hypothetical protein